VARLVLIYEMKGRGKQCLEYIKSNKFLAEMDLKIVHFTVLEEKDLIRDKILFDINELFLEENHDFVVEIIQGDLEININDVLKGHSATGIIISGEGNRTSEIFAQSRLGKLIGKTNAWFLVVPLSAKVMSLKKILVPIEIKKGSDRKLGLAVSVAKRNRAEIHFVIPKFIDVRKEGNVSFISEVVSSMEGNGVPFHIHAIEKDSAFIKGVLNIARDQQVDLIVVQQNIEKKKFYLNDYTEIVLKNKHKIPVLISNENYIKKIGVISGTINSD
jgi:hypothetical protein